MLQRVGNYPTAEHFALPLDLFEISARFLNECDLEARYELSLELWFCEAFNHTWGENLAYNLEYLDILEQIYWYILTSKTL